MFLGLAGAQDVSKTQQSGTPVFTLIINFHRAILKWIELLHKRGLALLLTSIGVGTLVSHILIVIFWAITIVVLMTIFLPTSDVVEDNVVDQTFLWAELSHQDVVVVLLQRTCLYLVNQISFLLVQVVVLEQRNELASQFVKDNLGDEACLSQLACYLKNVDLVVQSWAQLFKPMKGFLTALIALSFLKAATEAKNEFGTQKSLVRPKERLAIFKTLLY